MPGDDVAGDVGGFQMLLTKALKQQQGHLPLATAFTAANGRIVGDNLGLKTMAKEGRNHGFYHPTHPTFKKMFEPDNSPVFEEKSFPLSSKSPIWPGLCLLGRW